jgi:hypothetical protein
LLQLLLRGQRASRARQESSIGFHLGK